MHFPMYLFCNKVFSNEAMKPPLMQENLQKIHPDKWNKDYLFCRFSQILGISF